MAKILLIDDAAVTRLVLKTFSSNLVMKSRKLPAERKGSKYSKKSNLI